MRDAVLRQQKDRFMTPVAAQFFTTVHPNVVSLLALLIGLLSWLPFSIRRIGVD